MTSSFSGSSWPVLPLHCPLASKHQSPARTHLHFRHLPASHFPRSQFPTESYHSDGFLHLHVMKQTHFPLKPTFPGGPAVLGLHACPPSSISILPPGVQRGLGPCSLCLSSLQWPPFIRAYLCSWPHCSFRALPFLFRCF